jgi:hypothetical protein
VQVWSQSSAALPVVHEDNVFANRLLYLAIGAVLSLFWCAVAMLVFG